MRSILVYADQTEETSARLETALSLARATGGHLSVLIDTPVARFMAMDALGGGYLAADAVREAVRRDDEYAEKLAAHLRNEDVHFDVLRGEEEPVDAMTEASLLSDVIVLSRGCEFAGQLAVDGKAPILIVGDDKPMSVPVNCVAVAWDGSHEAAVALRGGLPLLKMAGQVHVLTVGDKAGVFPPLDAVQYLSRHGVKAEIDSLARVGSIEETLASAVARLGADLLVMGAFGHSRLREFLLGGVTRYFLDLKDGPSLLFAH